MVPIWTRGAADTQEFSTQSRENWPRPPPKSPRRAFFSSPAGRMEELGGGDGGVRRESSAKAFAIHRKGARVV